MNIHLLNHNDFNYLMNNNLGVSIFEEEKSDNPLSFMSSFDTPTATGRYHLLFKANITEKIAGISENNINHYYVPWELVGEKNESGKDYFVFKGWGDSGSGGHIQFERIVIGIEKEIFIIYLKNVNRLNPEYFSFEKIKKVIGLENTDLR